MLKQINKVKLNQVHLHKNSRFLESDTLTNLQGIVFGIYLEIRRECSSFGPRFIGKATDLRLRIDSSCTKKKLATCFKYPSKMNARDFITL